MFPNLTHLTISTDEEVVRAPNPEPSLSVRDLTIFGENTTLLNVMNLPNLKQLQIFNCEKWDSSSVEAHTQRSGCRLTTLSLHNVRIRGSELLQLLRALPTLETLQITQPFPNSVIDMVLAALTPRPHLNDLVLPVLTKIVLAGTYLFLTDSLLKLLEARLDSDYPGTSLAVIDITLRDRPIPTPDLERFAALRGSSFASLVCLDENRNSPLRHHIRHPTLRLRN
ncbi:hypothetical protein B0H19DRAFT_607838 [Mycena capillaripes]|nr:hypothetical protein B0H19DRAFT_607838 [Mycena capillaripes]